MKPGKHGSTVTVCQCVAIVLFVTVTVFASRLEPESPVTQNEKEALPEAVSASAKEGGDVLSASPIQKSPSATGITTSAKIFACVDEDTECTKDRLGYEAIGKLHGMIDDDHNGNVDQSESDEFLRDELQYTDGFERHSLFHNNDKLISIDDLWRAWKFSTVYNWTVDDVVDWLQKEVDLPQYSTIFNDNGVNGPFLPRLASSNTFITTVLGIRNPVHKQKLALKAMDTVLFGAPPKRHSYIKDLVLVALLIFAVGGCWFAYLHHRYSQEQVNSMMKQMEGLLKTEADLKKLQAAEKEKAVPPLSPHQHEFREGTAVMEADLPPGESSVGERFRYPGYHESQQMRSELEATQQRLMHAEMQLENNWSPPGELQAWLQLTYELELVHYNNKRQAAERQFLSAKDVCEKIRKRNKAFLGSLRMAHSNSLDEIDQRILDARMALEEVKQDLQERTHRWHTVENLCGFVICTNPGLNTLFQLLNGSKEGVPKGRGPGSVSGNLSVDEGDEDVPPAGFPPLPHSHSTNKFLRQRTVTGSTGSLSHVNRNVVGVNAAYSTQQAATTSAATPRGSHDMGHDSPSPTSSMVSNPVSFHLGEQSDRSYLPPTSALSAALTNGHGRSRNANNMSVSIAGAHAGYHGYQGLASGSQGLSMVSLGQTLPAGYTPNRFAVMDDQSDDNLSQTTVDSMPCSVSSQGLRDRASVNGVGSEQTPQQSDSESLQLPASRLEKKPSKKKKLLNMFRKTPKPKAI